jgi:hypothetical protein
MELIVVRTTADAAVGRIRPTVPAGVVWAQFGDEVVVGGAGVAWTRHRDAMAGDGARVMRKPRLSSDRLHVVVQQGRLFQAHHPKVPVLHDRGRYLLVDLDPRQARRIGKRHPTCYGLYPLAAGDVVFARGGSVARRAATQSVKALVDRVSANRFSTDLTALAGMHTRLSTSADYRVAVKTTSTALSGLGYVVRKQRISVKAKPSYNVVADRAGTDPAPRGQVVVTAHLDSINWEDGPGAAAPGADDNGSGAAGILEMARVFSGIDSKLDLRFVLFGGEEQGLYGSKHFVAKLTAADRGRIRAALNMDMIGSTNTAARTVLLEGSPISVTMMDALEAAAGTYTGLAVERSLHPFNSDHVSFIDQGIPSVLAIEGADSSNNRVHSARDTLDHVDVQLAVEILRMNVGFIAEAIGVA